MTEEPSQSLLGAMSALDALIFILSAGGATALHFVRKHRGGLSGPGQWLGDALNVGTISVLSLILLRALLTPVAGALISIPDVSNSNGLVILVSFAYCIIVIAGSLATSCNASAAGVPPKPSGAVTPGAPSGL